MKRQRESTQRYIELGKTPRFTLRLFVSVIFLENFTFIGDSTSPERVRLREVRRRKDRPSPRRVTSTSVLPPVLGFRSPDLRSSMRRRNIDPVQGDSSVLLETKSLDILPTRLRMKSSYDIPRSENYYTLHYVWGIVISSVIIVLRQL